MVSWHNPIPGNVAAVICDATSTVDGLRGLTGREVVDITPAGKIELRHRATQIVHFDITRKTTDAKVTTILRGLLAEIPSRRVGVIHHQTHRKAIQTLAAESEQIVKMAHFGGGDERCSNAWTEMTVVTGSSSQGRRGRAPMPSGRSWFAGVNGRRRTLSSRNGGDTHGEAGTSSTDLLRLSLRRAATPTHDGNPPSWRSAGQLSFKPSDGAGGSSITVSRLWSSAASLSVSRSETAEGRG